jgi:ribosomal protein S18 acetylase RimI-like enzyme
MTLESTLSTNSLDAELASETFGFDIVPAQPEDVPRLQQIEVDAGEMFRTIGLDAIADDDPPLPESLLGYINTETIWVAISPTMGIIGYVTVSMVDGEAHIDQVSVVRAAARHRVGAALMDQVVVWAVNNAVASITLSTFRDVAWNAPYYQRLGFREIPDSECGPQLSKILSDEHVAGIAFAPRVAMRRPLQPLDEAQLQASGSNDVNASPSNAPQTALQTTDANSTVFHNTNVLLG